jgi:methylmalonyl-CoA mutase cobalamin-binding domain/chain
MSIFDDTTTSLVNLEEGHTLALVRASIKAKLPPQDILDSLIKGVVVVGEKCLTKDIIIPQMMMATEIFRRATEILVPVLTQSMTATRGKVVIATVQEDIHDLGKNLVAAMLRGTGFRVIDLGVDVPPERIVNTLRDSQARVLCLSGHNTSAPKHIKKIIQALDLAGLRPPVKVIIGGWIASEKVMDDTGADAWGRSPQDAIAYCRTHTQGAARKG